MTALALLKRFWWLPVIIGLTIALLVQRVTIARQDARIQHYGDVMALTKERIQHAQAAALANDQANARAKEATYARATQETESALLPALDRARADAARYADQLRRRTPQGASGVPNLPYATDATSDAFAAREKTELDDAVACAEGVTKAEGWQTFWNKTFGDAK